MGTREAAAFNPAPTQDELIGATAFLYEEGYINGTQAASGDFVLVYLTARGMRAVEEGHLTGPRPVASPVVNHMTINGSNSGVAAQGKSVTQNVTLTADQVADLLDDVRKSIAGLGDRDREEAEVLVELLEQELTEGQPRPSKLRLIGARPGRSPWRSRGGWIHRGSPLRHHRLTCRTPPIVFST